MAILLIHGGASNAALSPDRKSATEHICHAVVLEHRSAADIAADAIAAMEMDPLFNAGVGSFLQLDGRARLDAGFCTSDGRYLATLMDIGYHSILSGAGAEQFARDQGFHEASVVTGERMAMHNAARQKFPALDYAHIASTILKEKADKLGTVGAVALDAKGTLAAGCSTGGTAFAFPGRIGDTAVFGAGVYCSEHVAVACTGEGDKILRRLTARRVEDAFLRHNDLQRAVDEALKDLRDTQAGDGGIIALSRDGQTASGYNTLSMAFAQKEE